MEVPVESASGWPVGWYVTQSVVSAVRRFVDTLTHPEHDRRVVPSERV